MYTYLVVVTPVKERICMGDFKNVSMASQVFDQLENDIIQGVYAKGEILTEQKLADKLGVSRPYVREALQRLQQEHLIEECGKGARVVGISEEDVLDIMAIREQIEGLAAYYAARNITPEGIEKLSHLVELQEFYFFKRDAHRLRQTDEQFHDMICTLGGRNVITDTLAPLHRKTRRCRQHSMENWERAALSRQEHYNIYKAIAAGDAELAQKLTDQHVSNAKAQMIKNFSRGIQEEEL